MKSYSPSPKVPWIVQILTIGGPIVMTTAVIVRLLRSESDLADTGGLLYGLLVGVLLAIFVFKEVQRQLQTCVSSLGITTTSWSRCSDFPYVCWATHEIAWRDVAELKRVGYTLEIKTTKQAMHTLNLIFYNDQEEVQRFAMEEWASARR